MPETATRLLPPFSGRDGTCPKCGCHCAETKWLIKPPGEARDHIPRTDEARERAKWFSLYWIGGNWDVARRPIGPLEPANWYPDEWLARHCLICKFRWDEATIEGSNNA